MKILLIDDDQDIADFLLSNLSMRGFQADHLLSGVGCMDYLKENHVDLILLDCNMPDMSGLDLLDQIREIFSTSNLPVIMVTSLSDTKNIVDALGKGCNDYITKPVNLETVIARIRTQISIKKMHDESLEKNKLEALNEVITTLNHEINNPLFIALNHLRKANRRADYTQLEKVDDALVRITNIVKQISELNLQSKEILKKDLLEEIA
ncbi:MAG: response regulator transcription factor [Bdellovibrionales bacterium]|nr:response regulator transcription factor [Bdellovibrionales bacterium]